MNEFWKPVPGFEMCYEVSNLGRVKSLPRTCARPGGVTRQVRERLLKFTISRKGYYLVRLYNNGVPSTKSVARLVALTFLENPENKPQVDHIDGDKANNCVSNLRWATNHENMTNPVSIAQRKASTKGRFMSSYPRPGGGASPTAKRVVGVNIKTGEIVSLSYIGEATAKGFNPQCVSLCCRKKQRSHKGFVFSYADK